MKIYTKRGDKGETSLIGGTRVPKHHIRINAYGTTDELNAHVGLLRDQISDDSLRQQLYEIQNILFNIGSILAQDPEKKAMTLPEVTQQQVDALEDYIDEMDKELAPLKNFILPGGHAAVSQAHVARCVCRRAEREVAHLDEFQPQPPLLKAYLNRLSDYFFTAGRFIAKTLEVEEVIWKAN